MNDKRRDTFILKHANFMYFMSTFVTIICQLLIDFYVNEEKKRKMHKIKDNAE